MAAWPYDVTATNVTGTLNGRGRWYTITTTSATNATSVWYNDDDIYYVANTQNWVTVKDEDAPPPPPDYVYIKRREISYKCQKPEIDNARSALAALPRGKLLRWKSLKEKRQAWGLT